MFKSKNKKAMRHHGIGNHVTNRILTLVYCGYLAQELMSIARVCFGQNLFATCVGSRIPSFSVRI